MLSKGLRKKKKKKGFPDAVAADFTALGIGEEGKPLEPADASEAAEEGPAANGHRLDSEEVGPSHGDAEANGETPELLFGGENSSGWYITVGAWYITVGALNETMRNL